MAVELKRHLWTLEQYHQAIEAGVFAEDDPFELIHGELIEMSPIGPGHAYSVAQIARLFAASLDGQAIVWPQNPVSLAGSRSAPQPDVALLRLPASRYARALPNAEDVLLVVEVADSSLEYDREIKLPLYAEAGVPEAWIINLRAKSLEIHREPSGGAYASARTLAPGESAAPLAFPELAVRLEDLIPE
jgi:Uma2 family endonuclease